jgi:hypothetical protein
MLTEVVATEFKFSETRYAQKEDISIAYRVVGDGAVDIVVISGLLFSTCQPLADYVAKVGCCRWAEGHFVMSGPALIRRR